MWKRDEAVGRLSRLDRHQRRRPPPSPDRDRRARRDALAAMERDIVNIGKSVIIKGELSGSEDLTIEGQVEGKIELRQNVLTIGAERQDQGAGLRQGGHRPRRGARQHHRDREGRHPRQRLGRRRPRRRRASRLPTARTSAAASTCSAPGAKPATDGQAGATPAADGRAPRRGAAPPRRDAGRGSAARSRRVGDRGASPLTGPASSWSCCDGRGRAGGAAPAAAARRADRSRRRRSLPQFLGGAGAPARAGPARSRARSSASNVAFFGERLGCKIYVEDLVRRRRGARATRRPRRAGRRSLATRFTQAAGIVDGILCWDLFDFLDRPPGRRWRGQLSRLLRPGGALLRLLRHDRRSSSTHYTRFVVDAEEHAAASGRTRRRRRDAHVLLTRDIIKMFDGPGRRRVGPAQEQHARDPVPEAVERAGPSCAQSRLIALAHRFRHPRPLRRRDEGRRAGHLPGRDARRHLARPARARRPVRRARAGGDLQVLSRRHDLPRRRRSRRRDRRAAGIAAEAGDWRFVAPDNGVLTAVFQETPPKKVVELTERRYARPTVSRTFEGRDRFAPAAAWLAKGIQLAALGRAITDYHLLDLPRPQLEDGVLRGVGRARRSVRQRRHEPRSQVVRAAGRRVRRAATDGRRPARLRGSSSTYADIARRRDRRAVRQHRSPRVRRAGGERGRAAGRRRSAPRSSSRRT